MVREGGPSMTRSVGLGTVVDGRPEPVLGRHFGPTSRPTKTG
jgi:hypothetical protein